MINFKTADTPEQIAVVDVLTALKNARQAAYEKARTYPEFSVWYERAEATYREFCEVYGMTYEPRFDAEEHIRLRLAQGHPDFIHYADIAKYADIVPFSLPRDGW